jgi:hypothetical protein
MQARGRVAETVEMSELGPVGYLLGVEILVDLPRLRVTFIQTRYGFELLRRFHMESCVESGTPEATAPSATEPPQLNQDPYIEVVGALQYLVAASRPDIAHATRHLGKYLTNFTC